MIAVSSAAFSTIATPNRKFFFDMMNFAALGSSSPNDVHTVGVQLGGADDLAHADGHHLDDAALDGRAEIGVRLDRGRRSTTPSAAAASLSM